MPKRDDIPVGRENAVARANLCRLWGCGDRLARRHVAALRAQPSADGMAILSSAHTPAGYWRSRNPAELEAFIAENAARACSTFAVIGEARNVLAHDGMTPLDLDIPEPGYDDPCGR